MTSLPCKDCPAWSLICSDGNIPPVLLVEILTDLKKAKDITASRWEVQNLANKLVPASSAVNVGFRDLVAGEILGYKVTADGRPVLRGGKPVTSQGKAGMIIEQSPEEEALLRWQVGSFSEAEELLAENWRRTSQAIDLEGMQRTLRNDYRRHVRLRTLEETANFVDELLRSIPPRKLLSWFLADCEMQT